MYVFESRVVERGGMKFRVEIVEDDCTDAPWQKSDCHGVITDWTQRENTADEWVLSSDGVNHRFYNHQKTLVISLAQWVSEYPPETRFDRAWHAVINDYDYLRGWHTGSWYYVGVVVTMLDAQGRDIPERNQSLWGIESNAETYLAEVADDLMDQLLEDLAKYAEEGLVWA